MTKRILLLGYCLFLAAHVSTQVQHAKGTITYITREAVYTSIGRTKGLQDSSIICIIQNGDTTAVLKVFALSSGSSACTVIQTKRELRIGDEVTAEVRIEEAKATEPVSGVSTALRDTSVRTPAGTSKKSQSPPDFLLRGRVSVQSLLDAYGTPALNYSQQSLVLSMTGMSNVVPVKFEIYSTLRSMTLGDNRILSGQSQNRSRIYRLFVEYDNKSIQFAAGRLLPRYAPSSGYIDGIMFSKYIGNYVVGTSFGYEPPITLDRFSTIQKKVSLFGAYQSDEFMRPFISFSYSRTYNYLALDREFISSSVTLTPSPSLFFTFMGDFDLRAKVGRSLELSPQVTSILGSLNYQPARIFLLGVGMTAWRPAYSFVSIKTIPDSLLDRKAQMSPSVTTTFFLPSRITVSNTYSPRSSSEPFGTEYSDAVSVSSSNIFNQVLTVRLNATMNKSAVSDSRGFGASLSKSFNGTADVSIRFQRYRHNVLSGNTLFWNSTYSADVMLPLLKDLTLWGSVERNTGLANPDDVFLAELSWKF
jgi:hypothetical protein